MTVFQVDHPHGSRIIGPGHPAFIIGEISGNHGGRIERALKLIDAIADAGCDAVKAQTYTPDSLTIDCDLPDFVVGVNETWKGKTLYELYGEAATPYEWLPQMRACAEARGLIFFSSPFDTGAVDVLEELNVPLYKVASFEIGDIELLKSIGATNKPVILSSGLASEDEIERAVSTLRAAGASSVAVLHCVSSYPATPDQMNLRTIPMIQERFGVVAGLSDHTLGTVVASSSIALGAKIIEKHVTMNRSEGGPDAEFSLEPSELAQLVSEVRTTEAALGVATFERADRETSHKVFRRSLYIVEPVSAGDPVTLDNVRSIRPGHGMEPRFLPEVLGRRFLADAVAGTPLSADLIDTAQ